MNKIFEQIGREVVLQAWFEKNMMQNKTPMGIPHMDAVVTNHIVKKAAEMGIPEPQFVNGEWKFKE